MKKDYYLEVMDNLMGALTQSPAWEQLCLEDPAIQASDKTLGNLLAAVVPDAESRDQIETAINVNISDYVTLGIWYGIQVAAEFREFDPHELSRRILSRREATA